MANGFAAFSFQNAICQKLYADFYVKKKTELTKGVYYHARLSASHTYFIHCNFHHMLFDQSKLLQACSIVYFVGRISFGATL